MTTRDNGAAALETHRRALTRLAYRMLALRAEAEDVVQDAYLRWHAIDRTEVKEPYHYLATRDAALPGPHEVGANTMRVVYRPVAANALLLSIPFETDRILRFLRPLPPSRRGLLWSTAPPDL